MGICNWTLLGWGGRYWIWYTFLLTLYASSHILRSSVKWLTVKIHLDTSSEKRGQVNASVLFTRIKPHTFWESELIGLASTEQSRSHLIRKATTACLAPSLKNYQKELNQVKWHKNENTVHKQDSCGTIKNTSSLEKNCKENYFVYWQDKDNIPLRQKKALESRV